MISVANELSHSAVHKQAGGLSIAISECTISWSTDQGACCLAQRFCAATGIYRQNNRYTSVEQISLYSRITSLSHSVMDASFSDPKGVIFACKS